MKIWQVEICAMPSGNRMIECMISYERGLSGYPRRLVFGDVIDWLSGAAA